MTEDSLRHRAAWGRPAQRPARPYRVWRQRWFGLGTTVSLLGIAWGIHLARIG